MSRAFIIYYQAMTAWGKAVERESDRHKHLEQKMAEAWDCYLYETYKGSNQKLFEIFSNQESSFREFSGMDQQMIDIKTVDSKQLNVWKHKLYVWIEQNDNHEDYIKNVERLEKILDELKTREGGDYK